MDTTGLLVVLALDVFETELELEALEEELALEVLEAELELLVAQSTQVLSSRL